MPFYAQIRIGEAAMKEKGSIYHGDAGKRLGAGFGQ